MSIEEIILRMGEAPRPSGPVSLEKQLEAFEALSGGLYDDLLEAMKDPECKAYVISLARKRLKTGYVEYRDDMFFAHDDELGKMVYEELADAVNWSLPIRANICWDCGSKETCDSWE